MLESIRRVMMIQNTDSDNILLGLERTLGNNKVVAYVDAGEVRPSLVLYSHMFILHGAINVCCGV